MCRCWNDEPTARPTFDYLVAWIDDVTGKARPAAIRADDSRFYLNVACFGDSAAVQPPHCQTADPTDAVGSPQSPDAGVDDDHVEELRYR